MSDIDLETLQQNLLISFREIAILLTNQDKKKRFSIEFWKLANCEKKEWQLCKFLARMQSKILGHLFLFLSTKLIPSAKEYFMGVLGLKIMYSILFNDGLQL